MNDSTMERYVAFICSELRGEYNVVLNEPKRLDGTRAPIKKIGPWVKVSVNVELVESYTRSSKLRLKFDKYEIEDIFYMSRHKSPDLLLDEIYAKIDKIVNKTYVEDGREEELRELYAEKHKKFNSEIRKALESIEASSINREKQ